MSDTVDATIIGAGPAGSTAAILLSRSGLSVRLVDKDTFPREKLCGEFLSGEGVATLSAQGLEQRLQEAGARPVDRLLVTTRSGSRYESTLGTEAVAVPRNRLDAMLADEAMASGATLTTGESVQAVSGSFSEGFRLTTSSGEWRSRVVIGAFGRSSALMRLLEAPPSRETKDPLVAFKSHAAAVIDERVVELHGFNGGYCGLLGVGPDTVNICWITRASMLRSAGGKPHQMIDSVLRQNRYLNERLGDIAAGQLEFQAASQLTFRPRTTVVKDVFMVGDAAGMIAPMCGDGMAMAINSASLLAPLVEAYLGDRLKAEHVQALYDRAWYSRFAGRMWLGRLLHQGFMSNGASEIGVRLCRAVPSVGRVLISATRGGSRAL